MASARPGFLFATVLFISAAFALSGCGGRPEKANEAALAPPDMAGRLVVEATLRPDIKPVSALLTNRDAGAARARIGGTLVELSVREGDLVTQGQVIAVIADERRTLEASAGASAATAAEARAIQARAELKRIEALFAQGVYAQARLDDARATARAAEAQLKAARAGSAALSEVASQGKVLAPADGRVTRAPIPAGAVVMPGDVIAEVATGRRVLRAELPEADGAGLGEGDEISISRSLGAGPVSAKILQVYPEVQNGKIIIDIDAGGIDGGFVGMRVPAFIPVGHRASIAIPSSYVSTRFGVDYVRVVIDENIVIDAPVQRGRDVVENGKRYIEIIAGLKAGDVIQPPISGDADEKAGMIARDAT